MGIGIKDVIGIVVTYIGTKALGAVPLKPTIGVNIQGTPAMAVDLFAVLGGMFPNLSAVAGEFLTGTFNNLALDLGLDPKNLFMSSPLGDIAKDIGSGFDQLALDLKFSAAEKLATMGAWEASAAALTSATDQILGLPSTAWSDYASSVLSEGAQILSPASLASNIEGTIANSVAIDQCVQQATSTIFLDAAKADIDLITSKLANAANDTVKGLLKTELTTKLTNYTNQMNNQVAAFEAQAAEIGKKLNPVQEMAVQVVPASINVKTAEALVSKAESLASAAAGSVSGAAIASAGISPEQLAAVKNIAQRMDSAVTDVFKTEVLPKIDTQLALEANTSITATTQLAATSTNIVYNNNTGYPEGVNLRYDA